MQKLSVVQEKLAKQAGLSRRPAAATNGRDDAAQGESAARA